MDKLNRTRVKELRDTLQRCIDHKLSEIASWVDDSYIVTIGNGSFNDDEVTFKLNIIMKGAKSQAEKDLEDWAEMDNLDLTKIVKLEGKSFSLSGYRRKAPKKPYLVQDLDGGGEYIMTREMVKRLFGKKANETETQTA